MNKQKFVTVYLFDTMRPLLHLTTDALDGKEQNDKLSVPKASFKTKTKHMAFGWPAPSAIVYKAGNLFLKLTF